MECVVERKRRSQEGVKEREEKEGESEAPGVYTTTPGYYMGGWDGDGVGVSARGEEEAGGARSKG